VTRDISRVTRSKEEARTTYNRLSRFYDLLTVFGEKRLREQALRRLAASSGERVLEIGFGTGRALVALARAVGPAGKVSGVDISDGMMAVAHVRLARAGLAARVTLLRADAASLPLPDASFDAVFASFTLELFDTPEIPVVLKECRRVLRPGGRLVVVALSRRGGGGCALELYEWAHRALPRWVDCRPIYVKEALCEAGFEIVSVDTDRMWGLPVETVAAVRPGSHEAETRTPTPRHPGAEGRSEP